MAIRSSGNDHKRLVTRYSDLESHRHRQPVPSNQNVNQHQRTFEGENCVDFLARFEATLPLLSASACSDSSNALASATVSAVVEVVVPAAVANGVFAVLDRSQRLDRKNA